MSHPDADARVVEQFLKTMAPPAALTAVYRQRVVCASLEARTKVLLRRQRQAALVACLCVCFLMLLPGVVLTVSARSLLSGNAAAWFAADTIPTPPVSPRVAVDGFERSAMEAQLQSRLQYFLSTRRAAQP